MTTQPHSRVGGEPTNNTIDWLLDSDPTLKWQVERDLLGVPADVWEATRESTAKVGNGKRLLDLQDEDGQWDGGAYFPGTWDWNGAEGQQPGQPWTATTWTLNTLRDWGVPASALGDTSSKLEANSRWEYEDLPYWDGEVDACINAFTLANGVWLGRDMKALADWFLEHQMEEGGWNCEWVEGSTRSSFHSTLNSLYGLLHYEVATGDLSVREARHAAHEYLLKREGLNRLTTGEPVGPWVHVFAYPFRHVYTALRLLDYFRGVSLLEGVQPDPRLARVAEIVRDGANDNGRWVQGDHFPGKVWFDLDVPVGDESKWLTLYALRALQWWDTHTAAKS